MISSKDFVAANVENETLVLRQSDLTFIVSPAEIIFRNFKEFGKYETKLQFKNQTTTTQYIRLMRPESRQFSISEPRGGKETLKVAAGLNVTYTVYFMPEEDLDYSCDLIAFTDYERFIIPVRAIGSRGKLSLPPNVRFDASPIKSTTRHTFLITNTGTKPCDWSAVAEDPFYIMPSCGLLQPNGTQQVNIDFFPKLLKKYESIITFDLGKGENQSLKIFGTCVDLNITLSSDVLIIPKTFISLERQGIVSVHNQSDVSVEFAWMEYSSEEEEARSKFLMVNSQPRKEIDQDITLNAMQNSLKRQFDTNSSGFKNLYFDDDVFTVEPLLGIIPARGKREFTITFNPQMAMPYISTAFLDIQGKSKRLPLTIKGLGLGPNCALGFDNLDFGDIFINSLHQYEVLLENRGSIEAKWMFQNQNTLFSSKFKFNPNHGIVPVGSSQLIEIAFCSDIIGIVSETFKMHIQGSKDELKLHFKGRVIGPTFHFDTEELDFGNVSYNFWHVKTFHIINTSEIPMKFNLRVPEDQPQHKEFEIVPSNGMILPHGKFKVQVDFLSNTVQEYNAHLVVDIDQVGENLDSLPIKATCIVPDIVVSRDNVDYGSCFIGYPYTQFVELHNETALSAKFEIILPSEDDPIRKKADIVIGSGKDDEKRGIVSARSSYQIVITMTAKIVGGIHLPLYIRILGAETVPHLIALSAKATGPNIHIQTKSIDFGSLPLLSNHSKPIIIVNNSPIPAMFTAQLTAKHLPNVIPPFTIKELEGVISPNTTAPFHVNALLDEAIKFEDTLVLTFQHNQVPESIQLFAKGIGFALIPSVPLDVFDFGDLFTTVSYKRTFILQNRGRRAQTIQWSNERGKPKDGEPIVFTIAPERVEIKGKEEEIFTIEGLCEKKGFFSEKFALKQSQTHKIIMKSIVKGNFLPPMLSYSSNSLHFLYTYQANSENGHAEYLFAKPLMLKNITPLKLDFSLKIGKVVCSDDFDSGSNSNIVPFTLEQSNYTLNKGENLVVVVKFDANYRNDRISHNTKGKLTIAFNNHPHRDYINLFAELNFPNLFFPTSFIDFGTILNSTEARKALSVSNPSVIPASYTWLFREDNCIPQSQESTFRKQKVSPLSEIPLSINNVFDIVPFRGVIQPGCTERIEFIFNGIPGRQFVASAVCQVEGGSEYTMKLQGEASNINYRFDKVALDFESQDYDKWEEREIFLSNAGHVPFPFHVDLSILSHPGIVEVTPMSGTVTDKVKFTIKFCPHVPDNINDNFRIFVAHFNPQIINVKGHGRYNSIFLSSVGPGNFVKRNESDDYKNYYEQVRLCTQSPDYRPYTQPAGNPEIIDPAAVEAERLLFRDSIVNDMLISAAVENGLASMPSAEKISLVKRKMAKNDFKYILSHYIIDLGHIIKGDPRKKTFKITNTFNNTVNISVNRKTLASTALSISPDKFNKLPPYGSQIVELTLNTKDKQVAIGPYEQEILFEIKNGPLVLVNVIANIVLPQIEINSTTLNFGTVIVGMIRMIPIVIKNSQPLPCEWKIAYPKANKGIYQLEEKRKQFACKPNHGILASGQAEVIHFSFTPTLTSDVSQKLLIQITANAKNIEISCTGKGEELNVFCDPIQLFIDPVFPFETKIKNFKIVNNSSVPVEVFSYDFDEKYLIEEEILLNAKECFTDNLLFLPPRQVGRSLPDNIMECYYSKLMGRDQKYAAVDYVPTEEDVPKLLNIDKKRVTSALKNNTQQNNDQIMQEEKDSTRPTFILVIGPAMSGKTVHSNYLSKKYGFVKLTLDDIVDESMEIDSIEGSTFRSAWSCKLFPQLTTSPVNTNSNINTKRDIRSKAETQKASQINSNTEIPSKSDIGSSVFTRAIINRLSQSDALKRGIVMDDISSFLTNNMETLITSLKDALSLSGYNFKIIDLSIDPIQGEYRAANQAMIHAQRNYDISRINALTDEEYDKLPIVEKRAHDAALMRQRERKKALQCAKEKLDQICTKLNEIKANNALLTVQESVEKELAVVKDFVDPKVKKTIKKSKEVELPPSFNWDEVTGINRFKKIYEIIRSNFDENVHKIINSDTELEKAFDSLRSACNLPNLTEIASEDKLHIKTSGNEIKDIKEIALPPPLTLQVIERPQQKRTVIAPKYFKILTPFLDAPISLKDPKKITKSSNQKEIVPNTQEKWEESTRWVIPSGGSQELAVQFCCDDINSHSAELSFGIVGTNQKITLNCSVSSSCPDIIRDIHSIFSKIKINKKQSLHPNKVLIYNQKRFNFGPILIPPVVPPQITSTSLTGKAKNEKFRKDNATNDQILSNLKVTPGIANIETLTITNSGLFQAIVKLVFENPNNNVFLTSKDLLKLEVGQSEQVDLLALPDSLGIFEDNLFICVEENPDPLKIIVTCQGTAPSILINGKKEFTVDFGRLLIRKVEEKTITLRNESLLPARWFLSGAENIPPEFMLDFTSGVIEAETEISLKVKFSSERTTSYTIPLKLVVSDADEISVYETLPFNLKAEAHDIIVEWTKEVNFKTIRVGDIKKETIRLLNKSAYEIAYLFKMSSRMSEMVSVSPQEGTIRGMHGYKDAAICSVEATFKPQNKEVTLSSKRFGDIELHIIDPSSNKLAGPPQNIVILGEALYHKYSIKPQQLSFGACLYKQKKAATFEIVNSGVFEIKFKLYNFREGIVKVLDQTPEPEQAKKKTDRKPKKGQETEPAELMIGPFGINPSGGTILPGSASVINVFFLPEGNALFNETLGIYIEDVNPSPVNSRGIPFELEGESCIPGIIADLDNPESDSIFEEQQIVPRLDAFRKIGHFYAREEKVFSFGLTLSGNKQMERLRITNSTKVSANVNLKITPRGDAPDAKAAAEVFKIIESKTINGILTIPPLEYRYITICFTPTSLNSYCAFFEATVENGIDPKTRQLKLELRGESTLPNVTIGLPPPPVKQLSVTPPQKTVKGKARSSISVVAQEEKTLLSNTLVLLRTIVGKSSSRSFTVRNSGDLPATIRFSIPKASYNSEISFPRRNENILLPPGTVEKFTVYFEPSSIGTFTSKLIMSVLENRYEDSTINIIGVGFEDNLTFEDIDENTENKLSFGDCYINVQKSKIFKIVSHTTHPMRFKWNIPNPFVSISPLLGHLPPGTSKNITMNVNSAQPSVETTQCLCSLEEISYEDSKISSWDSNSMVVKWFQTPDSPSDNEKKGENEGLLLSHLQKQMRRVNEPAPEPSVVILNNLQGKELYASYISDYTYWELSIGKEFCPPSLEKSKDHKADKSQQKVTEINSGIVGTEKNITFATTKLFQSRFTPIFLRNIGKVSLPFSFSISCANTSELSENENFILEPASGEISQGKTQELILRYRPSRIGTHNYILKGNFPYGRNEEVIIPISGSAECPLVHFELPQSNSYLIKNTEKQVDQGVGVIEFDSKGVNIRNIERFMVLNPSNADYEFQWIDKGCIPLFKCSTLSGTIRSSKKFEMIFEFCPETLETFESEWIFTIPKHNLSLPFILIGRASEPDIYFSKSKVDFGHVIVGSKSKTTITIENRESNTYSFSFDQLTNSSITFSPMSGTIPADGSLPIDIIFEPIAEEPYNSTLKCYIKKALSPLTCNVKGEGYITHDIIQIQDQFGNYSDLLPNIPNVITFPTTAVNGASIKKIAILNRGTFNFDYKLRVAAHPSIYFSKTMGTVVPGEKEYIDITFKPAKEGKIIDQNVVCNITNGNTYTILLNAIAANPLVSFSWNKYDFGTRFLHDPSTEPATTNLTVINNDKTSVSIDTSFENKEYLEIDVSSFVLNPGEKRDIKFNFFPKEQITYYEVIVFTINDLTSYPISVSGEGTLPKIEVSPKTLRFGSVQVSEKKSLDVRVFCKSKIPTLFSLENCIPKELSRIGISVNIQKPIWLLPKETRTLTFTFNPVERIRNFNYDIDMIIMNKILPFLNITGVGLGVEVHLDCKEISFGSVVIGSKVTRRVLIVNTGDSNLNYNWNERRLGKDFFIYPISGTVLAHNEARCDIEYAPTEPGKDIQKEFEVKFDLHSPISLSIVDTRSVERPPLMDILNFSCCVRESVRQKIDIKNDSQEVWNLRPVISNPCWSAPESITIKSHGTGELYITYSPTICTKNKPNQANDSGTLFIALPNGNALLYKLDGVAELPSVSSAPIERELLAKVTHVEKLMVSNWLGVAQKFSVVQNWSHDQKDESVSIKGVPTIDVPGNSKREYRLAFSSFKEGKFSGTINFVNESTGEYQYYNLVYIVKPAKETGTIELRTPCRTKATYTIILSNPLSKTVNLITKVDNPELIVPSSVQLPPKSNTEVQVEFFPILVKDYPPSKIIFSSQELGEFPFTVNMAALQPLPEKITRFNCSLGQCVSATLRFRHFCKTSSEFGLKLQDPKQSAFFKSVPGPIKVTPATDLKNGLEVAVDVTFEPSRIGDFKETIELTSNIGGNYYFPLQGVCTPPQRQGPIEIKPNQSAVISFKNVFNENVTFSVISDSPHFVVGKTSEIIQSKKSVSISIQYKCEDVNAGACGKLTITGAPNDYPIDHASWVYYLKGMKDSEVPVQPVPISIPKKK